MALQMGVSIGASAALRNSPNARAGLAAAKEIICAVASSTNANPAAVVTALDAYWTHGINDLGYVAALGAVNLLNLAVQGLQVTNNAAVQPYVAATCAGLQIALINSEPAIGIVGARPVDQASWPLEIDPRWPLPR
jgi:hypothetical protein